MPVKVPPSLFFLPPFKRGKRKEENRHAFLFFSSFSLEVAVYCGSITAGHIFSFFFPLSYLFDIVNYS